VQHSERRIAACQCVTGETLEQVRSPLVQVEDPRRQAFGVQAQP